MRARWQNKRIAAVAGAAFATLALMLLMIEVAAAHGVAGSDRAFLEQSSGRQLIVYAYLGAKHMVTGYDHLLFLFGVVFFLYRMRDVGSPLATA
jgi:hypothetical protein